MAIPLAAPLVLAGILIVGGSWFRRSQDKAEAKRLAQILTTPLSDSDKKRLKDICSDREHRILEALLDQKTRTAREDDFIYALVARLRALPVRYSDQGLVTERRIALPLPYEDSPMGWVTVHEKEVAAALMSEGGMSDLERAFVIRIIRTEAILEQTKSTSCSMPSADDFASRDRATA